MGECLPFVPARTGACRSDGRRGQGAASEDKANSSHLVLWIWMAGSSFPPSHHPFPFPCSHFHADGCVTISAGFHGEGEHAVLLWEQGELGDCSWGTFPAIAQMHDEVICIWSRQTKARCLETALQGVLLLWLQHHFMQGKGTSLENLGLDSWTLPYGYRFCVLSWTIFLNF